jgi:hypothetical protein
MMAFELRGARCRESAVTMSGGSCQPVAEVEVVVLRHRGRLRPRSSIVEVVDVGMGERG